MKDRVIRAGFLILSGVSGLEDDLFKQETNCPPFRCPEGQIPVQKRHEKKSGWPFVYGCDTSSFDMLTMMDPTSKNMKKGSNKQKLWKCCVNRDIGQQVCSFSKKQVEGYYSACSEKKCKGDKNCKLQSSFGLSMSIFGSKDDQCKEFTEYQASACTCVEEKDKEDYFKKAIRDFYGVFAKDKLPEGLGKDELVTDDWLNATVYKKFQKGDEANIWNALFTKYSSKLTHKERPRDLGGYDDILGKGGKGGYDDILGKDFDKPEKGKGKGKKKDKKAPSKEEKKPEEEKKPQEEKAAPQEERSILDDPAANFGEEEVIEEEL